MSGFISIRKSVNKVDDKMKSEHLNLEKMKSEHLNMKLILT